MRVYLCSSVAEQFLAKVEAVVWFVAAFQCIFSTR